MLFFNLVKRKVRLFTNKQEFFILLHSISFRQFHNLSEETWSHAAENFIELCFIAFLNKKSKSSRYRFCIALYGRSGNKNSNLNELKFDVKFKQMIFKRQPSSYWPSSYWPNIGVGDIESFKFLTSWQAPGTQKGVLTNQIRAQWTVL